MAKGKRSKPLSPSDRIELRNAAERAAIQQGATRDIVGRDRVLEDLEGFRKVNPLDYLEEIAPGAFKVKSLEDLRKLPLTAQRFIRKINISTRSLTLKETGDTVTTTHASLELHDIIRIEEMIGKYLHLWKDGDTHQHLHLHAGEAQRLAQMPAAEIDALRRALEADIAILEAKK